jgi:hypothetical protein
MQLGWRRFRENAFRRGLNVAIARIPGKKTIIAEQTKVAGF